MFRATPALQQLETQMNYLIQLTGQSLMETDNINDEKKKVIEKIGTDSKQVKAVAGKPTPTPGLDVKLSQHLQDKKQSIIDCKKAIEDQKKLALRLTEDIEIADKERTNILAEKKRTIDELTKRVEAKQLENEDTEKCIKRLTAELAALQQQLDTFSKRATNLERGKRLQTIFSAAADPKSESDKNNNRSADLKKGAVLPRI